LRRIEWNYFGPPPALPVGKEENVQSEFQSDLSGVMAIADEVDPQLVQAMASYVSESIVDALPVEA
jgi:hypothetical protein